MNISSLVRCRGAFAACALVLGHVPLPVLAATAMRSVELCGTAAAMTAVAPPGALRPAAGIPAGARWSDPATWGGQVPRAGDVVHVPAGITLALDAATAPLAGVVIEGRLHAAGSDLALTAGYIAVTGGVLEIGTPEAPYTGRAVLTLTGLPDSAEQVPGMGSKVLAVLGGTLSLHGAPATSWTRLAADAPAGATRITLAAAPVGWNAGDRIVIAPSTADMATHDVVTVAAVAGTTVTLAEPLRFRHLGSIRRAGEVAVDVRAEVGRLTRNIVVRGDAASAAQKFGGHAMFMHAERPATIRIAGVEFVAMGQLNRLGRYPIHFHLMGDAGGSYVRDAAVHTTVQRGIVLHGVSGVVIERNVVFDTVGHNVFVEDPQTTGNVLRGNLALVNRQPSPLHTEPTLVSQNDRLPSNFWMKSGANLVEGNHAAGAFASGFIYDGIGAEPVTFLRNTAHAAMDAEGDGEGDFDLAAGVILVSEEVRPAADRIEDTLVYHNAIGFWPEEVGPFVVTRLLAADNTVQTENRGVGNEVKYVDAVFVGRLTEPRTQGGPAVHFQYGSDVTLERPHFADYGGGGVAAASDVALPSQGTLVLSGARYSGTMPLRVPNGDITMVLPDDTFVARGVYHGEDARPYSLPGAARVTFSYEVDELDVFRRSSQTSGYVELDVRDRARVSARQHTSVSIRRSDGLTFRSGMFGYTALYRPAGIGYELTRVAAGGYAFRLNSDALIDPVAAAADTTVRVVVPVAAAPRAVHRTGTRASSPNAISGTNALRRARDAADFAANPLTTFLYDEATRKVTAQASARWIVIVP